MKKIFLLICLLLAMYVGNNLYAQNIGINSTGASPDASAMLDISATNAGLLVPRVTLASLNDGSTIANPATSLLVYNTGGSLGAGYYYNSGTTSAPVWTPLATGGNYWTSADGINIYNTNTGTVNIGSSTPSAAVQSVYSDYNTNGYFAGTEFQNVAVGSGSFTGFYTGLDNDVDGTADVFDFANAPMNIGTNFKNVIRLSATGNAGIGTGFNDAVAKTEITAFGPANNIYTIASGYPLVTGLATYESDTSTSNEKVGQYSFVDGSTLENEAVFGEAGSTGFYNIGVFGRLSFAPASGNVFSSAVLGYDAIGTATTHAAYFEGNVYTNGNSAPYQPATSWLPWSTATYSANNTTADTAFTTGSFGFAEGAGVFNSGVVGISQGDNGSTYSVGVTALSTGGTPGNNFGVFSQVINPIDYTGYFTGGAVFVDGQSAPVTPSAFSPDQFNAAILGENFAPDDSTTSTVGVFGLANGNANGTTGVLGVGGSGSTGGFGNNGLVGIADDGPAGTNYGLYAEASANASDYAAYFLGQVVITGNLSATGTKNFQIDNPEDPAHSILRHAAVESNEVLNQYSGNITTDANGYATVQMPGYFQTINKDFRYQLTVIGSFAQAIIKQEVSNNQFIIQTNQPNIKVSWQVTGVRNDKHMQAHPFVAVEEKTGMQSGKYFEPELYGQPASLAMKSRPSMHTLKQSPAKRPMPNLLASSMTSKIKGIDPAKKLSNVKSSLGKNISTKLVAAKTATVAPAANGLISQAQKQKANASKTVAPAQKK